MSGDRFDPGKPPARAASTREIAALLRVKCGVKTRAYGLTTVCDYPIGHVGPHRGASK